MTELQSLFLSTILGSAAAAAVIILWCNAWFPFKVFHSHPTKVGVATHALALFAWSSLVHVVVKDDPWQVGMAGAAVFAALMYAYMLRLHNAGYENGRRAMEKTLALLKELSKANQIGRIKRVTGVTFEAPRGGSIEIRLEDGTTRTLSSATLDADVSVGIAAGYPETLKQAWNKEQEARS